MSKKLVVVSGPSGAGISDIVAAVFAARGDVSDPALQGDFAWFCGWLRPEKYVSDPLTHAQLFWINERFPKAALVDPESGLVAIMT